MLGSSNKPAASLDECSDGGVRPPAVGQLVPIDKLLALVKACLVPGKGP